MSEYRGEYGTDGRMSEVLLDGSVDCIGIPCLAKSYGYGRRLVALFDFQFDQS